MKHTLHILIFPLLLLVTACRSSDPLEQELSQLDNVLDHRSDWVAKRQATIDQWRDRLQHTSLPEERYWISKALFEEYFDVNSDSALVYAERCNQLAQDLGKEHDQWYWTIQKGLVLGSTGQLEASKQLLCQIRPKLQDKDSLLLSKYYGAMLQYNYLSAHYEQEQYYSGENDHFRQEIACRDSSAMYLPTNSLEFLNLRVWQYYFEKKTDRNYLPELEEAVLHSNLDSQTDGTCAFMLAQAYREEGNAEKQLKYLILSAMAYVKSGSTNYSTESFQELCQELEKRGDLTRAYTYINFCANNLSAYDNRVQTFRVAHLQNIIKDQYLQQEKRLRHSLTLSAVIIGLLAIVLLTLLFFLFKQVRKVRQKRIQLGKAYRDLNQQLIEKRNIQQQLESANNQLVELNSKLQSTNDQLTEANFVKEEYIGYLFSICSTYIDKLDKQRKNIARKLKAGQLAELSNYSPTSMEVQNDMKEFYQSFDSVFLRIYPNFVEDLNALMQEGEQFTLREEGHLNTDLRILALMRLGISDCEKTAEFLHCSVQSVYNSRRSVYSRLRISKEEFKELVPKLGNSIHEV